MVLSHPTFEMVRAATVCFVVSTSHAASITRKKALNALASCRTLLSGATCSDAADETARKHLEKFVAAFLTVSDCVLLSKEFLTVRLRLCSLSFYACGNNSEPQYVCLLLVNLSVPCSCEPVSVVFLGSVSRDELSCISLDSAFALMYISIPSTNLSLSLSLSFFLSHSLSLSFSFSFSPLSLSLSLSLSLVFLVSLSACE